jgi:hypothetical protein
MKYLRASQAEPLQCFNNPSLGLPFIIREFGLAMHGMSQLENRITLGF